MVIIKLQGGLGNQMFQYACGKAFALKHDKTLLIDDSFLNKNQNTTDEFTPRAYALGVFNLDTRVADELLLKSFEGNGIFKKVLKQLQLTYRKSYQELPGMEADQLDSVQPPVLLNGYWQSEQYFAAFNTETRKTFEFNIPAELEDRISTMNKTNSVSIHYRRGDYLTNPVAQKVLGTLDEAYYQAAVQKVKTEIVNPFFYIFSDDTEWVNNNLPLTDNYQVIDSYSGDKHWYDMLLMSKCKHHIIANSSFSWWGAWLNPAPQKMVIAPKRWFADEEMNARAGNLIPSAWLRV